MYVYLHIKYLILIKFGFSGQIFIKVLTTKFHENLSGVSLVDICGQTGGRNVANILGKHGGMY